MRMISRLTTVSLMALSLASAANAQGGNVVMRKAIAKHQASLPGSPGTTNPTPAPAPVPPKVTAEWTVGGWGFTGGAACTTRAEQTRSVRCERSGSPVDASECSGTAPVSTQNAERTDGCAYSWKEGAWSDFDSSCSANAERTRQITCMRSDGTKAADGSCEGSRPVASEVQGVYSSCSAHWNAGEFKDPGASCNEHEEQIRSVACIRDLDHATVGDERCGADSRPSDRQEVVDIAACHYDAVDWTPYVYDSTCSATASGTRTATCRRSDGKTVTAGDCTANGISTTQTDVSANYSGCSYGWTTNEWGPWSATCGNATRSRTVACQSSDGRTVDEKSCGGARPAASQQAVQTGGCGYEVTAWTPWSYGSVCSDSTTRTRTATECTRTDRQTVGVSECSGAGVDTTQNESGASNLAGCTYSWTAGEWTQPSTTCGTATQTRKVACERSDGVTTGDDKLCSGAAPASTQNTSQVSGCTYNATYTAWSQCGYMGTKYRSVTCTRSDAEVVEPSFCGTIATEYAGCELQGEARGVKTHAEPGEEILVSPNGQFHLVMQTDGDLTITKNGSITWHTNTNLPGTFFDFQGDGNMVLYFSNERTPVTAAWHTDTWANPGSYYVLDDVGQLTIYNEARTPSLIFRTQGGTSQYNSPTRR